MAYLKFEEAVQVKGRTFRDVEVAELGGTMKVQSLSAGKALQFKEMQEKRGKVDAIERKQMELLLEAGCVNEDGSPFFAKPGLAAKFVDVVSFDTLQLLVKQILGAMGIDPEKEKSAEGNSEASQSESSPSV